MRDAPSRDSRARTQVGVHSVELLTVTGALLVRLRPSPFFDNHPNSRVQLVELRSVDAGARSRAD